jgi:CRP-like cAMP-binding protein
VPGTLASRGDLLGDVSLFAGLEAADRVDLATRLRRRRYARGEPLFLRGDPGSFLYVIERGRVKIALSSADGKEMILVLLGPGDFFGELALLDGGQRSADAVVVEDAELLLLGREDFLRCVESRPRIALHLLAVLSRRLRSTDQLVHDAAFFDVPGRLASALLRLGETLGQPAADGVLISRRLTQLELAEMIGSSRESVNKWLSFYQRQGFIRMERGLITIVRREALQQRVY